MTGWTDADLDRLRDAYDGIARADAALRAEIAFLRQRGCSWRTIAAALGLSVQTTHARYRSTRVALVDQPLPEA